MHAALLPHAFEPTINMATLQTTGETSEITQLTELEYTQALVEKQRRLISTKDRDIRELSGRVQAQMQPYEKD